MDIPAIVGKQSQETYTHVRRFLARSRNPVALVGPTGTGKSLIMLHLLNWYSEKYGVPSFYLQMSPDVSRTTLVGGFRLIKGSLKPIKGVIMRAQDEGGIVGLDEFTHAHEDDQASLNSALNSDKVKIISIGEITSEAQPTTRYILAHNPFTYQGNHPMPLSLRRRLYTVWVDFPDFKDEFEIASAILNREFKRPVAPSLIRFLLHVARECRTEDAPICASNVASASVALMIAYKHAKSGADLFPENAANEATISGLYKAIHGKDADATTDLGDKEVRKFIKFVSRVSSERFKEIVLGAFMGPYLPTAVRTKVDGMMPAF